MMEDKQRGVAVDAAERNKPEFGATYQTSGFMLLLHVTKMMSLVVLPG